MEETLRKSGITIIGEVPWGTHFCQFYQTKEDLIDILVPYFKAGIENNEFCMWVTSMPMTHDEALEELRKAVPDIDHYLEKGQIEILPHTDWYLKGGGFDSQRVLNSWIEKLEYAFARGYEGLRLTGNTFWLEDKDWQGFVAYEEEIERVIGKYRMIAMCTYSLNRCGAAEVIDVVNNHEFALIKRDGNWSRIEDSGHRRNKDALRESQALMRAVMDGSPDLIYMKDIDGKVLMANPAALRAIGKPAEQVIGRRSEDIHDNPEVGRAIMDNDRRVMASGITEEIEEMGSGGRIYLSTKTPYRDSSGNIAGIIGISHDITERIRREEQLSKLNRTLKALSDSSKAMMRASSESKFLDEICRIIVEDCGYSMVWIGFAEDDENKTVRPVAHAGFDEGYIERLNITWADTERGRGPTGTAIRTGKPHGCRNMMTDPQFAPWREEALKRGYASSLVLPIMAGNMAMGAITIYAKVPDPFTGEEISLLTELANDLAYGIAVIRLNDAHEKAVDEVRRHRDHLQELVEERAFELEEKYAQLEEEILERRHTEKMLEISLAEIADLYNNAPCGYHSLDAAGVYIRINDTELQWLGYTREEVIGKMKFSDVISPASLDTFNKSFPRLKAQGWISDLEFDMVRKDGTVIQVLLNATAVKDSDGDYLRSRSTLFDITGRKKTEEALRLANAYNRSLIEASLDPLVTIDTLGRITDVNIATEKVTGCSREELIGTDFSNYFTKPDQASAGYQRVFSEGSVKHYPLEILHRNGQVTPVLYNAAVYHDETGNVIGVFAAARDMTEHKLMEEEIRNAAYDWQATFDSIKDQIMILDKEFRIDRVNAATADFFNLSPSGILNNHCYSLMHGEVRPIDGCPLAEMLKTKKHEETEVYDNERDRWFIASVDPVFNGKGDIVRVVHTVRDITERKRVEEEKKRLEIQLIQAQKIEALGKLSGGVAHDFNNVLQPILINSELIADMLPQGTQMREYLDQIIDAAQLGKNLIRQIKLFGTKKEGFYNPIAIGPVVQDALTFFKRTLPGGIKYQQSIASKNSLVQADPTQVYQLILNLCTNAVQAMKSDKGTLSVSLKETKIVKGVSAFVADLKPGWYMKLTVRDTGYGISPDIQEKIFDPFFTTRKSGKGTGLGLAVVHEVVKNVGGSILLHSEVGKGTQFNIFLPVYDGDRLQSPVPDQGRIQQGQGEKHILLVDDNASDLQSVRQLLVHLGHSVASTSDPQEALNIFRRDPDKFDMIITDQVMPRMKGHELAIKARRIREDIPIILCSGSEEALRVLQDKKTDVHAYMLKPFTRSELENAIAQVST
ncbi:MAG TPA: PAS domain S-box protein [Desulfomonilia bacterium]|nr:PAS domain S-box protein [Desulfomonilia bacterium]